MAEHMLTASHGDDRAAVTLTDIRGDGAADRVKAALEDADGIEIE